MSPRFCQVGQMRFVAVVAIHHLPDVAVVAAAVRIMPRGAYALASIISR